MFTVCKNLLYYASLGFAVYIQIVLLPKKPSVMIIDPPIHVPLCPAVTLWSHFQAVGTVELQRETGTTAPPPLPSLPWLNILASFSVICDQSLL